LAFSKSLLRLSILTRTQWHRNERANVASAGFQQKYIYIRLLAETIGQNAARGARTNYNKIVNVLRQAGIEKSPVANTGLWLRKFVRITHSW
jgi:hypothetical protein